MNGSIVLKSSWISIELMIIYLPKNKKYIKSTFIWKKGKNWISLKKHFILCNQEIYDYKS